jgi:hypothetical protein
MPTQDDLLKAHAIKHEYSCVAWGFEFIAKWHERLPFDQFPIQEQFPKGLGVSEEHRKWFFDHYGISTEAKTVPLDDLQDLIRVEAEKNLPPILILFSRATAQYRTADDGGVRELGVLREHHTFAGFYAEERVYVAGRLFDQPKPIYLSWPVIAGLHAMSEKLPLAPGTITCLLHTVP